MSTNESFKVLAKNDSNIYDYYSFEKIFKKKNLLRGHSSHQILDYLSFSLNHPINYHPNSLFSAKYTKVMHDILLSKLHFHEFNKYEQSQKTVLRILNQAFFQDSKLYKSDYNNNYFMKQTGASSLTTNATFCGSKQQIIMVDVKQTLSIMKQKMRRAADLSFSNNNRKSSNSFDDENLGSLNLFSQHSSQ